MTSYCSNMSVWLCWVLWALFYQSAMTHAHLCGKRLADTLDTLCAGRGFHMGKRNGRSIGSVYGKSMDSAESRGSGIHNILSGNIQHSQHRHITHNIHDNHHNIHTNKNIKTQKRFIDGAMDSSARAKDLSYFNQKRKELQNFLSNIGITRTYNYTEGSLSRHAANSNDDLQSRDYLLRGEGLIIPNFRNKRKRRQAPVMNIVEECCLRRCDIPTLLTYCAAPEEPEEEIPEQVIWSLFQMTPPVPRITQRPPDITLQPPAQINRGTGRTQTNFFYVRPENRVTRAPLLVGAPQEGEQRSSS